MSRLVVYIYYNMLSSPKIFILPLSKKILAYNKIRIVDELAYNKIIIVDE